ncbi:hypothetical protein M595_5494 [Lyngbya aestuarii BL J]|uniref:Uncharacterized protein n=1 Tax=Lyngbya aestuarii BL J TaxID=1348334 RepID=U7Q9P6_9CYAN|nr:hypothetical protein M595_6231 [Lyngbya aestuarii BL J]ERT04544.1 hypothetical protein M595_5494 [Lyngbya aestuarii BL J]
MLSPWSLDIIRFSNASDWFSSQSINEYQIQKRLMNIQ